MVYEYLIAFFTFFTFGITVFRTGRSLPLGIFDLVITGVLTGGEAENSGNAKNHG